MTRFTAPTTFVILTASCFAAGLTGFGLALLLGAAILIITLLAIWVDSRPTRSLRGVFLVTSVLCVIWATVQVSPLIASSFTALALMFGTLTLWATWLNHKQGH